MTEYAEVEIYAGLTFINLKLDYVSELAADIYSGNSHDNCK
jgi:hypothetical protein